MTLSTWQLIVVGALAAIWAVVLGVPLLADLLRWLRNRPPVPRVDRRPVRHNLVEWLERAWWERPRPIRAWRSQDVVRRRLQWLLGCGLATTVAMFLAIALRGLYVPLFLVMVVFTLVTVVLGAVVGAAERETIEAQRQARLPSVTSWRHAPRKQAESDGDDVADLEDLFLGGLLGSAPLTPPDDVPTANPFAGPDGEYTIPTLADITEAFRTPDRSGFMFEPLNLDEVRADLVIPEAVAVAAADLDVPVDPDLAEELGLATGGGGADAEESDPAEVDAEGPEGREPRFNAAPGAGTRQASARARRRKRSKARPIYIESVLDEAENPSKAIND